VIEVDFFLSLHHSRDGTLKRIIIHHHSSFYSFILPSFFNPFFFLNNQSRAGAQNNTSTFDCSSYSLLFFPNFPFFLMPFSFFLLSPQTARLRTVVLGTLIHRFTLLIGLELYR